MRRSARLIIRSTAMAGVGGLAVLLVVCGYVLFAVTVSNELSIQEVDWNGDGIIAVSELIDAMDIRGRHVLVEGKACKEYFNLKDGLPIRLEC